MHDAYLSPPESNPHLPDSSQIPSIHLYHINAFSNPKK